MKITFKIHHRINTVEGLRRNANEVLDNYATSMLISDNKNMNKIKKLLKLDYIQEEMGERH